MYPLFVTQVTVELPKTCLAPSRVEQGFFYVVNCTFLNVLTINCIKYANSRHGMSSLIIKDIKYHILRSLTHVILELLPQTLDYFRACHIFLSCFLIFCHILWKCAPMWWPWEILTVPSFRSWLVYTSVPNFHSNRPKKYRNSEGGTMCPPPPLGLGDLKIAWAL